MKRKLITILAAFGMSVTCAAQLGPHAVKDPEDYREYVFPWMMVSTVAQLGPVSLGLELAPHSSELLKPYELGYGASLGYNHQVGDYLDLTLYGGYIFLGRDANVPLADFPKCSLVPIQVGGKYYLSKRGSGIYTHVQGGIHNLRVATPEIVTSSNGAASVSYLSGALGVGYVLNNKIDVGLCYNIIAPDSDAEGAEASNYLGVRLAYTLLGGGK
jgi:hypothetical protein